MLALNEVCENFIASNFDTTNSSQAAETTLSAEFESLSAIFGNRNA
jgi:hypothetical protein